MPRCCFFSFGDREYNHRLNFAVEVVVLIISTLVAYLLGFAMQVFHLCRHARWARGWLLVPAFLAVGLHAWLLHQWIDVAGLQNLSFFNVLSLVAWLNATLISLLMLRKPAENLWLLAAPFAMLSIVLVAAFPSAYWVNTAANPLQLIHILLSLLTFSILCVAALQAALLAVQEQLLRKKRWTSLSQMLPSVQAIEILLFQCTSVGFLMLSLVLVSGLWSFDNLLIPGVLQKTLLAIVAWLVFAGLLIGRFWMGWRGLRASYATLIGVGLLALSYFGSRWLVEILG